VEEPGVGDGDRPSTAGTAVGSPQATRSRAEDFEAHLAQYGDDVDALKEACRRALTCGDENLAAPAHFRLGLLLHAEGDAEGAVVAYRRAVDSGAREMGPKAANNLGCLLVGGCRRGQSRSAVGRRLTP
jgi:hypothetical protein